MSGPPRVSAIVIFLDAKRFFEEAIESIIGQDYADWELLLVDDGSTDGTADIARRYAEVDPLRIRYLTHPGRENRGMSASRNLGIREARGEYVAFLDADDTWLPGKLARQVAILDSYPHAAMVYGPTLRWYSWNGEAPDEPRQFPLEVDREFDPPNLARWLLRRQAAPAIGSILARRAAVLLVGGFEANSTTCTRTRSSASRCSCGIRFSSRASAGIAIESIRTRRASVRQKQPTTWRGESSSCSRGATSFEAAATTRETWWLVQRESAGFPTLPTRLPRRWSNDWSETRCGSFPLPVSPVRVHRCGPWAERR